MEILFYVLHNIDPRDVFTIFTTCKSLYDVKFAFLQNCELSLFVDLFNLRRGKGIVGMEYLTSYFKREPWWHKRCDDLILKRQIVMCFCGKIDIDFDTTKKLVLQNCQMCKEKLRIANLPPIRGIGGDIVICEEF
jgi:hypothetical protein